jgi:hypothetical protein
VPRSACSRYTGHASPMVILSPSSSDSETKSITDSIVGTNSLYAAWQEGTTTSCEESGPIDYSSGP